MPLLNHQFYVIVYAFYVQLNLVDVEGLNWADKKRDGVIAIRVSIIVESLPQLISHAKAITTKLQH